MFYAQGVQMARERFSPRPLSQRPSEFFSSAETAWLWFWQCQLSRESGARVVADQGAVARPCDPDDIYRLAMRAMKQGHLSRRHLMVLVRHGRALLPPDSRLREDEADAVLWGEGLMALEPLLVLKGILGPVRTASGHGGRSCDSAVSGRSGGYGR